MDDQNLNRNILLSNGIKPTAQRIAVAQCVFKEGLHTTAESVQKNVVEYFPTISLATIYNTLNLFVNKGLLRELKIPQSEHAYFDNNIKPHCHLYDEDTKQIYDLPAEVVQIDNRLFKDFELNGIEVLLTGKKNKPHQTEGEQNG